jgi:hypothetical protein
MKSPIQKSHFRMRLWAATFVYCASNHSVPTRSSAAQRAISPPFSSELPGVQSLRPALHQVIGKREGTRKANLNYFRKKLIL